MSDMASNIKATLSVSGAITAAVVNGVTVANSGFEEGMLVLTAVVTGVGTTSAWKLQEGLLADGSDAADVPNAAITPTTGPGTYVRTASINLAKRKRYLRLQHTGAGGAAGGTATGIILFGNPMYMPVTQDVSPVQVLREALKSAIESTPPGEGPVLLGISPESATVGDPVFDFHCVGARFTPESIIVWNGGDEPTTFVSANELTTPVNTATMVNPATLTIQVRNADGKLSEVLNFEVLAAPAP